MLLIAEICDCKDDLQRCNTNNNKIRNVTYPLWSTCKIFLVKNDLIAPHCTKFTRYQLLTFCINWNFRRCLKDFDSFLFHISQNKENLSWFRSSATIWARWRLKHFIVMSVIIVQINLFNQINLQVHKIMKRKLLVYIKMSLHVNWLKQTRIKTLQAFHGIKELHALQQ